MNDRETELLVAIVQRRCESVRVDVTSVVTAAGSAATAVGIGLALAEFRLRRLQERTTFEDSIVRQYREIIRPPLISGALVKENLSDEELAALFADFYGYIDLCNEQVFLRALGRVSERTWRIWVDGIESNLKRPGFKESWERIRKQTPDDFQELQLLEDGDFRDPRRWKSRWMQLLRRDLTTAQAGERLALAVPTLKNRDDWSRRAREEREREREREKTREAS